LYPVYHLTPGHNASLIHKDGSTELPENFRMIALTSCVGKIHHQILADRFVQYLTLNNYIDKEQQKAFIKLINGCTEHNFVVQEIISHARANKKLFT